VTISDLDPGNPSFVNGLPAGARRLQEGDQIQIGGSVFVLRLAEPGEAGSPDTVRVEEGPPLAPATIVMSREDLFGGPPVHRAATADRLRLDLAVLLRVSGATSAVRGLVELERPIIGLIADVVPASRGALVLTGDHPREITSAVGWSRGGGTGAPVQVSRSVIERVLRDVVGILTHEAPETGPAGLPASSRRRTVLAAPLVAFDKLIGAIVLGPTVSTIDLTRGTCAS
jgi:hypothetical protein